jgi:hypothetical protein
MECFAGQLEIPPTPGLKVCGFGHGECRREARKEVAVILAIGHALRAHEALGRPDALPGFLEVVHRLLEDGVFVCLDRSIRVGIPRSPECFAFSRERLRPHTCNDGWVTLGQIAIDPETGEESAECALYLCRKCLERS